jgi:hypothetical protein
MGGRFRIDWLATLWEILQAAMVIELLHPGAMS